MDIKKLNETIGGVETSFYPLTHEEAVVDDNGTTMASKIDDLETKYTASHDAMVNTQEAVDDLNANTYRKSETYNKTELNNMITTPEVEYVNVEATDQTTDISDVLPATGAADTIYKIGSWDGTQYDTSKYTEYTWDGTNYIPLATRDHGVDDEPTAGSDNLVKSGGVAEKIIAIEGDLDDLTRCISIEEDAQYIFKILSKDKSAVVLGIKYIDGSYIITPYDGEIQQIEEVLDGLVSKISTKTDSDFIFKIENTKGCPIGIQYTNGGFRIIQDKTSVKEKNVPTLLWNKGTYSGENNSKVFYSSDFVIKEGERATITFNGTYVFSQIVSYKAIKTTITNGYIIDVPGTYRIEGGFSTDVTEIELAQVASDFIVEISNYVNVDCEPLSSIASISYSKPVAKDNKQFYKKEYVDICDFLSPIWGQEYLEHWYERIYDGSNNVSVALSGDSITQGYEPAAGYDDCFFGMRNYFVKKIMKAGGYDLSKLTVYNCGVGGRNTNEYVGNPIYGSSSWIAEYPNGFLDEDMALNPDLYILGWGMNDVLVDVDLSLEEKLAIFTENMEEALMRIRGVDTVNGRPAYNKTINDMSIIICSPIVGGYPKDGRGYYYWNQYVRETLIPLCRKYFCAYADFSFRTYQHLQMSNIWGAQGNNPQIHPNKYSQAQTMSMIQDLIYPIGLWQVGEIEQGGINDRPRYSI